MGNSADVSNTCCVGNVATREQLAIAMNADTHINGFLDVESGHDDLHNSPPRLRAADVERLSRRTGSSMFRVDTTWMILSEFDG